MTATLKSAQCPTCGTTHEFEPCDALPDCVPLCDACDRHQAATWKLGEKRRIWRKHYVSRLPKGYLLAEPEKVPPWFVPALKWTASEHHGGMGLIGDSGAGKSCAMACRLWTLETPFLWWSGTEARDAAIEVATADKDREGASRRWEHAMRVEILVIDDISQGRMTEAWSSKLFDILETRLSNGLPTLWTCQVPPDDLRAKIIRQNGGDTAQADAIERRLAQHSLVLKA